MEKIQFLNPFLRKRLSGTPAWCLFKGDIEGGEKKIRKASYENQQVPGLRVNERPVYKQNRGSEYVYYWVSLNLLIPVRSCIS